jgi:hypothetical protein
MSWQAGLNDLVIGVGELRSAISFRFGSLHKDNARTGYGYAEGRPTWIIDATRHRMLPLQWEDL